MFKYVFEGVQLYSNPNQQTVVGEFAHIAGVWFGNFLGRSVNP